MKKQCEFSQCRKYRYTLWRSIESTGDLFDGCNDGERGQRLDEYLMVIGLNPSTADEKLDDPTIRRCVSFAKQWGFGALCMTNLFAYRDTQPSGMMAQADPIGPDNDQWLMKCAREAGMILAAWGNHGAFMGRDKAVMGMIPSLYALRRNKDGSPQHPLYVPQDTIPEIMSCQ